MAIHLEYDKLLAVSSKPSDSTAQQESSEAVLKLHVVPNTEGERLRACCLSFFLHMSISCQLPVLQVYHPSLVVTRICKVALVMCMLLLTDKQSTYIVDAQWWARAQDRWLALLLWP